MQSGGEACLEFGNGRFEGIGVDLLERTGGFQGITQIFAGRLEVLKQAFFKLPDAGDFQVIEEAFGRGVDRDALVNGCLLYTSPSPRD